MMEKGPSGRARVFTEGCRSRGAPEWQCLRCGRNGAFERDQVLSDEEFNLLVSVCVWRGATSGFRDAAILVLIRSYGFSPGDVENLELEDWLSKPPTLILRARNRNPPREQRAVALDGDTADLLLRWLLIRGQKPGRMFLPVETQGNGVTGERLGQRTIRMAIRKRGMQAGLGRLRLQDVTDTAAPSRTGPRRASRRPEPALLRLSAAARALAATYALREGEDEPCPLAALVTEELEQLRRRVSVVLFRRMIGREGPNGTTAIGPAPENIRRMIAKAVSDGAYENEIARVCGFDQSDVHAWVKRYREGGSPAQWAYKMGPRERQVLEGDLLERPYASMPQRCRHLASVCGVMVSVTTATRHAKDLGFRRVRGRWTRSSD